MDKNLKFDTLEGYVHTVKLVQALASYLKKHGWEKRSCSISMMSRISM